MICDGYMCINRTGLVKYFDSVIGAELTLCDDCFATLRRARRRWSLPDPQRIEGADATQPL